MTRRDFLKELEEGGLLEIGIRLGIISIHMIGHSDMFDYWFKLLPDKGSHQAALAASDKFNVDRSTILRAVKSMRTHIDIPVANTCH